jgi:hypothetical protein
MKKKLFVVICFVLAASTISGCKNKSAPQSPNEPNTITENIVSEKPVSEQAASKPTALEAKQVIVPLETKPIDTDPSAKDDDPNDTEYFALYMDNHKVGYAIQKRVIDVNTVITSIKLGITLSRTGFPVTIETTSSSTETIDGKPLGFEIDQNLGLLGISSKTVGKIYENGKMVIKEGDQEREMDWPEGALMSEGMRLLNIKNGLKEGTSYKAKMFEPSSMTAFDVDVQVGAKKQVDLLGRVVELTEIKSRASSEQLAAIDTDEFYDDNMKLQKSITPVMGFIIEQVACSKEFAMGQNDVYEVVDKMFLASPAPINNISSVKSITYHMTKTAADANLTFPSTDNQEVQKLSNGNVILTIAPLTLPQGVKFPYKGSDAAALEALKPTRYVESDEKIIKDLAKQAVGSTTDAAEAARKIEDFVADYITNKDLSVGYASAAEVAVSRQGDCTEHAVLTAALCRAVGIPAQVVSGLAYVSQWHALSNGFGGHAWTQVYIGDKWYNIDAAFKSAGWGGYDAGHIALSIGNGNPEDFLNIVNTLGHFKIEKIKVKN